MDIVVSKGRSVRTLVKGAKKTLGPGNLIRNVPDDEARFLIARGFATQFVDPRAAADKAEKADKPEKPEKAEK